VKLQAGLTETFDLQTVAMRSCLSCRKSLPKREMLRLVLDDEGLFWPDLLQKAPGRGVYHCMSEACLSNTNDRRLQSLKAKFPLSFPQWDGLQQRIKAGLGQQLQQIFARLRVKAAVGRDAVMHRLWNNAPLLLLLAEDAGDAVARQVGDAMEKRRQAGHVSSVVSVPSRSWLGEMLGRECVAIAGFDADGRNSVTAKKMKQYCVWYGRIKVSG
jgi:predicted RNA-binding protein YlxR (DUF448 family)